MSNRTPFFQQSKTTNETDFSFQPLSSPDIDLNNEADTKPSVSARWTYPPEDEDDIPPKRTRKIKREKVLIESDRDSDEDYIPSKPLRKRTRRISSDSSKDSGRVSKYRELRDKNNEASRKSRLQRKLKEQQMETELQELESKNVRLKAKADEMKRMVDNFRSNLFKIMARK